MGLLAELKRRKVFRVSAGYVVFAWLVIQIVDTIFPAFGLDTAAFRLLVITLAIGLVPVVVLSWAFELTRFGLVRDRPARARAPDSESVAALPAEPPSMSDVLQRPHFLLPLVAALLLSLGTIAKLAIQLRSFNETRIELLPRIETLINDGKMTEAFELALEAERYLPDDPALQRLWSDVAVRMSILSEPEGAEVEYRRYGGGDTEWQLLGTTPVRDIRLARGVVHWRLRKPGFETAERAGESFNGTYRISLVEGDLPEEMVSIPPSRRSFLLTGYAQARYATPQFRADRFETTNEAYLEFVRAGGYSNPEFWSHLEFVRDGQSLDWQQAVDTFRDRTGRHGPATWEGGTFPEGAGRLPVAGISWFEAAAYARFREKQLPTIRHWSTMTLYPSGNEIQTDEFERPGFGMFRTEFASRSHFSQEGLAEVGSNSGVSPFGTYDGAGNVREWCWNAIDDSPGADRYILGGSAQDPDYLYSYGVAKSPWDRSGFNGVRLVSYDSEAPAVTALRAPEALPARENIAEVTDEIFEVYRAFFDYDHNPLNPRVESVDDSATLWKKQTISFDATYESQRVVAHVFLPRNVKPPFQFVVYFPSSIAIYRQSSDQLELKFVDFIIKSGRAVAYPVLWGTYERNIGLDTTWPRATREYSNNVVRWIQDIRRTVDYLNTRDDFDPGRLGYYGFSWGGWNGPIVLALDDRFATGAFLSGGIPPTLARPEASSASYASRVSQPVLMLSGRNDVLRPLETYQVPMFNSLGTPSEHKRHAILDGGHYPSEEQIIAEVLPWFDRYLGTVE